MIPAYFDLRFHISKTPMQEKESYISSGLSGLSLGRESVA